MGQGAQLLGESPGIAALRDLLGRILARQVTTRRPPPVLIQGETGAGKGLLARALHEGSSRATGPFVALNCAAIPESLLEAELFGVERGAFTGADQARPGLFRAADRGTLFLDEIGAMPLTSQAKLLAAIEDRVVRPLGSVRTRPVDVWIIAATSEDLRQATRDHQFREDLYHRLAAIPLTLPPLRDRGADILLLAEHFLARACAEFSRPVKEIGPDARRALLAHQWPGNVRELANVMERTALLTEAPIVTAQALELPPPTSATPAPPTHGGSPPTFRETLSGFERTRIVEALGRTGWNVVRAAELLGVPRTTLRRRMARYQLVGDGAPPRVRRTAPDPMAPAPDPSPADLPLPAPSTPRSFQWGRRAVTLLCVDVDGADPGPGAVAGVGRALEVVADRVASFGGRVVRIWPHRVAAAFGIEPGADAPVRAVQAAFAIQRALEQEGAAAGVALSYRSGVHLDAVPVGQVAAAGAPELALDDEHAAWGVLDELLEAAEPHTVMASTAIAPFLARGFLVGGDAAAGSAPVGRLAGRVRPRLPGTLGSPGRPETRFVGRDHELAVLEARLATVEAGHGQVVGIIGEPGIGKSRLLHEFHRRLDPARIRYLEGHCLVSGQGTPYGPIVDLVRAACGVADPRPGDEAAARARETLARLGLDADECAPYLLHLLGVPGRADALARLSAETIRLRTFEAVRQLCLRQSVDSPLVLAVEDLHWSDATSEALLSTLADALPGARILVCTTYRPGYQPAWMGHSHATQVALSRLSPDDSLALARSLLGESVAGSRVETEVVPRAAGNPFFLEELLRASEAGAAGDLLPTVPASVQATILARMQQLPVTLTRVLKAAAVLGQNVEGPLLRDICAEPDDLGEGLQELVTREFLQTQPGSSDDAYVFKHALTQEVAYGLLDPPARRALHLAAAQTLERRFGDHLDVVVARLAHHYARTDRADKAIEYLTRAADKAIRAYGLAEALVALRDAVEHAKRLPGDRARDHMILDLVVRQAFPLAHLGRFEEMLGLLRSHESEAIRLGDDPLLPRYYFWLFHVYDHLGRYELSSAAADRALNEAARWNDWVTKGMTHGLYALECFARGRFADGVRHGRDGMSLMTDESDPLALGHTSWALSINAVGLGDLSTAAEFAAFTARVGESRSEPRIHSYGIWVLGWVALERGDTTTGVEACQRAVALAPDPVSRTVTTMGLGYAHLVRGDAPAAVSCLEDVVPQYRMYGLSWGETWASAWLADALIVMGQIERARDLATHALDFVGSGGSPYLGGLAQRALGRAAMANGVLGEAESRLTQATDRFAVAGARGEVARTQLDLAVVARQRGDPAGAHRHLAGARDHFEALGIPHHAARAAALAQELAAS
jgi:transcriptional regulator with AAA-type ATPase domain/tetratricopeptide (TPR) repeat protein